MTARAGFTLLEVLIVMTLIVLLAGIALPQISASIRRQQANTAAMQFARDLQRARVEALKRNDVVFVAKTGTNSYNIRFVGDRYLPENAVFGTGGPDTLRFAPFGPPTTGAATYSIRVATTTRNVTVSGGGHARVH